MKKNIISNVLWRCLIINIIYIMHSQINLLKKWVRNLKISFAQKALKIFPLSFSTTS